MGVVRVVVLTRPRAVAGAGAEELWAPVRWALSWSAANDGRVDVVVLCNRRDRGVDAGLAAMLDRIRVELPGADLSLRAVSGRRNRVLADVTEGADLLVVGSGPEGGSPLSRRAVRALRCPWLVVAGGGVPGPAPEASGSRQEPSEDAASGSRMPNVD